MQFSIPAGISECTEKRNIWVHPHIASCVVRSDVPVRPCLICSLWLFYNRGELQEQRQGRESELGRKPSVTILCPIFLPVQGSNGNTYIESRGSLLIVAWEGKRDLISILPILPCVAGLLKTDFFGWLALLLKKKKKKLRENILPFLYGVISISFKAFL